MVQEQTSPNLSQWLITNICFSCYLRVSCILAHVFSHSEMQTKGPVLFGSLAKGRISRDQAKPYNCIYPFCYNLIGPCLFFPHARGQRSHRAKPHKKKLSDKDMYNQRTGKGMSNCKTMIYFTTLLLN